jgi:hypothetical protein
MASTGVSCPSGRDLTRDEPGGTWLHRRHACSPIRRARADIRPEETTSALVPGRAVSSSSVHALAARPADEDVRPFRRQALMGHGMPPDGADMHPRMTAMTSQALPHAIQGYRPWDADLRHPPCSTPAREPLPSSRAAMATCPCGRRG